MRIPITRFGRPQTVVLPVLLFLLAGLTIIISPAAWPWPLLVAAVLTLAILAFFRDPHRHIPADSNMLLAPADGKITDITNLDEPDFIQGPSIRIGIFLSVFDVHINRAPCPGTVDYLKAKPGKCINALRYKKASSENQANSLGLLCPDNPAGKVLVKQITGAIARRIVCDCQICDQLTAGQKYGMIKLGSRTELFIPANTQPQILIEVGQTVRAGSSILAKYPPIN